MAFRTHAGSSAHRPAPAEALPPSHKALRKTPPRRPASAGVRYWIPSGLLCISAAANSGPLDGMSNVCRPTDIAPALSPNKVTRFGSPPNDAMLR